MNPNLKENEETATHFPKIKNKVINENYGKGIKDIQILFYFLPN